MTPELKQRARALLAALEPLSEDERAAELARLRSSEPEVAAEVGNLLAVQDTAHRANLDSANAGIPGMADARDTPATSGDVREGTDGCDSPTAIADNRVRVNEVDHTRAAHAASGEDPDATPPDVPGCILGCGKENVRFGGMGVVYFGTDSALGRPVAVKVLRRRLSHDAVLVARFEAEARINAQLQHPGIVPVHQIGKLADGRSFYTMKRVKGDTLSDVLKRRASPSADLLGVLSQFRQVCEAMAYAHARNVLHRDLKPQNVMIGEYGEVLLMDWGLAKILGDDRRTDPREEPSSRIVNLGLGGSDREPTRGVLGTLPYMPPEQAAGLVEEIDKRSDVFGLGAILCTILTGKPPYIGVSDRFVERKALEANLDEAYHRLTECGADPEIVALTRKCLSPRREDRAADAREVAKGVAFYLAGVEERRRQAELERVEAEAETREQKKRRRVQLALATAIGLLVVGVGGFAWWEDKRATERGVEAKNRERDERERVNRNTAALTSLVGACEDALRADDVNRARAALDEADRRATEGGGEAVVDRLARCRGDLAILTDLDTIDTFRWTQVENKYPTNKILADRWRAAFRKFGIVPDSVSVDESARRVLDSLVKDRLLSALSMWLVLEPSAGVRAILGKADLDGYREGIRDAVLVGNKIDLVAMAGQAEALAQPPWFAAMLGEISAITKARRREVLEVALQGHSGNLTLLMSLGGSYPVNQAEGAEDRMRWFQAVVAAHPGNFAAHNNLGIALSDKGDWDGAIREHKAAIVLDPYNFFAHNNLGNDLVGKEDWDGAIAECKVAILINPRSSVPHLILGNALSGKGDLDWAIREYKKAIEIDPRFAYPHNGLGNALYNRGDVDGAIREFKAALSLDSKYTLAYNGLGVALDDKGDLAGAIHAFNTAIQLNPKYGAPHTGLGNLLYKKGDRNGAIGEYNTAIHLDPKRPSPYIGLGVALKDAGDVEGAIRAFNTAIQLNPKYALAHNNLGTALKAKGDLVGAIREYNTAIQLDPNYAAPHINLGHLFYARGDLDESIREFHAAIQLNPNLVNVHTNLGNSLKAKGDLDGAIHEFKAAIQLDAKYIPAHRNLGTVFALKGDWDRAIREYQTAIQLDPKISDLHNLLGNALANKGDLNGAILEYKSAIQLDPKDPLPHMGLGSVLKTKGDLDGEISAYRQAVRLKIRFAPTYTNLASHLAKHGETFAALQTLRDGLQVDPRFIEKFRYNLACYASLVAYGQAKDAPLHVDRSGLRLESLGWLTAELTLARKLSDIDRNKPAIHKIMLHWLADTDLDSVRAVENLPADERESWAKFWSDVRKLRDETAPRPVAPLPRLVK